MTPLSPELAPRSRDEWVCELRSGPDDEGRYSFDLLWLADYNHFIPVSTRPDGLFLRAQSFFSKPSKFAVRHPIWRVVDHRSLREQKEHPYGQ